MKAAFEEKWNAAVIRATERCKKDEYLKTLQKKETDYIKRLEKIREEATRRSQLIFFEEIKKELEKG